ncbi:MFS transporter [Priestia flexa]|uniref:MFS transporter n=1 Tax=Priestia flexa TaxID=86664 RepID=UPI001B330BF7|nr:MFS transporter [Priestia flexa]
MNRKDSTSFKSERGGWLAVLAITLGALSLVITEFLPVGLIPDIGESFGVSKGTAGLALTSTAILGMVAAPLATIGIGRIDRRKVLLTLTLMLILSNILSVLATNFILFMIARIILGIGVGAFWAISIAAAISVVSKEKAARASALVFSGISIGSVISVPAGAFLAAHFDWKISLIAASILSIVVFFVQLFTIPKIPMERGATIGDFILLLRSWKIRTILLALIFTIGGQYAAYTYVTPFLQQVTGIGSNLLSFLLFAYGALGIIGNFLGGLLAERNLSKAVVTTSIVLFLSLLIMTLFGDIKSLAIIGLVIWAIAFGMAPICIQLWLSSAANSPEIGQATYTTVYQFSIGFGSLIGGVTVDHINLTSSMALGSLLTLGTMIVVAFVLLKEKHSGLSLN